MKKILIKIKNKFKSMVNKSYGYGDLKDIDNYISRVYSENYSLLKKRILVLPKFTMAELANDRKHCSLTALTRILAYYHNLGYENIDSKPEDIYKQVKSTALRQGYSPIFGTIPFRISAITRDSLKNYNYGASVRGIYAWTFYEDIVDEIDQARPLIFNVFSGYYGKHSVCILGYVSYYLEDQALNFIVVDDAWTRSLKFIDFNSFVFKFFPNIGSLNKITIEDI